MDSGFSKTASVMPTASIGQRSRPRIILRACELRFDDVDAESSFKTTVSERRMLTSTRFGCLTIFILCLYAVLMGAVAIGNALILCYYVVNMLLDIALLLSFMLFSTKVQIQRWFSVVLSSIFVHLTLASVGMTHDSIATVFALGTPASAHLHSDQHAIILIACVLVASVLLTDLSSQKRMVLLQVIILCYCLPRLIVDPSNAMAYIIATLHLYLLSAIILFGLTSWEWRERVVFAMLHQKRYMQSSEQIANRWVAPRPSSQPVPVFKIRRERLTCLHVANARPDIFVTLLSQYPEKKTPNTLLMESLRGRHTDWMLVDRIVSSISSSRYSLKHFHDDCVAAFPELQLFRLGGFKQEVSAEYELEHQRTMGALFSVYWLLRLDSDGKLGWSFGYDEEWEPLSVESMQRRITCIEEDDDTNKALLADERKRIAFFESMDWGMFSNLLKQSGCHNSADRKKGLICLTAFHDIMKVKELLPVVQPEHAPYLGYASGVVIHDHDIALAYILEHYPTLLPSYGDLDQKVQKTLAFTQTKMNFNHGWFVQAEAPPGAMLSSFKAALASGVTSEDVAFHFVHWFTDLAGACGTPFGGAEKFVLKFPQSVLAAFLWSIPFLGKLTTQTETQIVENYLKCRWRSICPDEPFPEGPESIALARLLIMTQSDDRVLQSFRMLPVRLQSILAREMSRTGVEGQTFKFKGSERSRGGPAFLVYYGPALLQKNANGELQKAMALMAEVYRCARILWPLIEGQEGSSVIIQIGKLKEELVEVIVEKSNACTEKSWVMTRHHDLEGSVALLSFEDIEQLRKEGTAHQSLEVNGSFIGELKTATASTCSSRDEARSFSIVSNLGDQLLEVFKQGDNETTLVMAEALATAREENSHLQLRVQQLMDEVTALRSVRGVSSVSDF